MLMAATTLFADMNLYMEDADLYHVDSVEFLGDISDIHAQFLEKEESVQQKRNKYVVCRAIATGWGNWDLGSDKAWSLVLFPLTLLPR